MADRIIVPQNDQGEINFNADFARGVLIVSVREPMSITRSKGEVAIVDAFEVFAQILLESCRLQREQAARVLAKVQASRNGGPS